ncbi:hypothetical protein M495_14325 [Serratia liquefaciens ATCC 27592]|uniref:hypothetical protein n=1 Tax=Serratia liquefaciens TaxID=614 RepID=UPI0003583D62|nr:hypothetical protein [Serratia liquefaciens]AGQ31601.1 hypothetical protein M495_14325 [Serratia liquefaciens ATCC 27592]
MATIIDALVVTLGLDASGFKKGQEETKESLDKTRKNSEQTAKDMEAAGKRAASFFGSIRTELLALVGVTLSANGIKNFITSTANSLQQLGINSKALDMSAKSLDGWSRAAEAAGSSAEKMQGTLAGFQGMLTEVRTGGGKDNPLMIALSAFSGATGTSFDYKNDNSESIMRKIAQNWGRLKNDDLKRRYASMFGFDNSTQLALSNGNLVSDADRFAKISKASEEATDKASKFNRRLVEMKQNFSAAAQVLFEALIPYIEKLIPLIESFGVWITTHGPEIERFFRDTADTINKVAEAAGGWQNVMEGLLIFIGGKWLLGMISAIGGVKGALIALSRVSLIAGLVELQKYAEVLEKKYAWLTDNPVANTLNNLPGMEGADSYGKMFHDWVKEKIGINLPRADGYGQDDEVEQRAQSSNAPRGIRNNNPGNLNYAKQSGATKESGPNGRFAVFNSMTEGVSALYKQIQLYFQRGTDTISEIVNKYAPASDNNNVMAYINSLVKATGKGAHESLASSDMSTIFSLLKGIISHENGKGYVSDDEIMRGIQVGSRATMQRNSGSYGGVPANKTDIHIAKAEFVTSANNQQALAQDVQRSVGRNSRLTPSLSGQG